MQGHLGRVPLLDSPDVLLGSRGEHDIEAEAKYPVHLFHKIEAVRNLRGDLRVLHICHARKDPVLTLASHLVRDRCLRSAAAAAVAAAVTIGTCSITACTATVRLRLHLHLVIGATENVCVVLGEATHARQAPQSSSELIPVCVCVCGAYALLQKYEASGICRYIDI